MYKIVNLNAEFIFSAVNFILSKINGMKREQDPNIKSYEKRAKSVNMNETAF